MKIISCQGGHIYACDSCKRHASNRYLHISGTLIYTNMHTLEALTQFRAVMTEAWVLVVSRAGFTRALREPYGNISHPISGPFDSQSLGFSTEGFLRRSPQVPSKHASPVSLLTAVILQPHTLITSSMRKR